MSPRSTALDVLPVRSSIEITTHQFAGPAPTRRPSVLVIDCDEVFIQLVRHVLSVEYQVLSAHDLAEALQVIRRGRFDVVMLDLSAPLWNGVELLEKLRAHPGANGIPVLAFSTSRELRRRLTESDTIGVIPRARWLDELRHMLGETVRLSSAPARVPAPPDPAPTRTAGASRRGRTRQVP